MQIKIDDVVHTLVVSHGLVVPEQLSNAVIEAARLAKPLMTVLVKNRMVKEEEIMKFLSQEFHLDYVDLKGIRIDKQIMASVPYRFAWHYKFVPLSMEKNVLTIAVAAPLDIKAQDELRLHFGHAIRMVLSSESDVADTLVKLYGLGADTIEKILSRPSAIEHVPGETSLLAEAAVFESGGATDEIEDIEKLAGDASVIKLVNQIILEAYKKRATDIHIEPYRNELKLRYRIDGVLYEVNASPQLKQFFLPLLSRIKIMSNLNIVERRLPQDGRAIVRTQEQVLDLRVSFIPTPYGESVVIRILPTGMIFSLDKLGLARDKQNLFEDLILKPHGIIFVTGPTGSGKTTTLYACLTKINKKEKKIITIEDPIEYEMPGMIQIQVMPEIGLTFGRGLRAMLRHDPDIMMVGEVRDLETAEIAIRVSLTGHLVFSTLHTNNAASGISRLIDIGVEPYLLASSVEAFIAQRLVRVICPFCKKEDTKVLPELRAQISKEIGDTTSRVIKIYRGEGCQSCNFTGFHGRTAIFEMLVMNEAIRNSIFKKPSTETIHRMAISAGMRTLRQDGWYKVIEGLTTPEEILNVTADDGIADLKNDFFEEKISSAVALPDDVDAPTREIPFANKRVFQRLDEKVPITWKAYVSGKPQDLKTEAAFRTLTNNIGAGGLVFSTKEPIAVGVVLELHIELPQEQPLVSLVRVVRVEEVQAEAVYKIAICFLDLSGADRARLNRFVSSKLRG